MAEPLNRAVLLEEYGGPEALRIETRPFPPRDRAKCGSASLLPASIILRR